jgi:hypothetical protein
MKIPKSLPPQAQAWTEARQRYHLSQRAGADGPRTRPPAMIGLDELKVPKSVRSMVDEVVAITDSVCLAVLDEEYADLARRAVAKLARKRPSPLLRGRRAGWAAGVVYALGQANFLFRARRPAGALQRAEAPAG